MFVSFVYSFPAFSDAVSVLLPYSDVFHLFWGVRKQDTDNDDAAKRDKELEMCVIFSLFHEKVSSAQKIHHVAYRFLKRTYFSEIPQNEHTLSYTVPVTEQEIQHDQC